MPKTRGLSVDPIASSMWPPFCPSGLMLHAAVTSFGGVGLMFLGRSRAGKSTLAAAVIRCGGQVVSDDYVSVALDQTTGDLTARWARTHLVFRDTGHDLLPSGNESRADTVPRGRRAAVGAASRAPSETPCGLTEALGCRADECCQERGPHTRGTSDQGKVLASIGLHRRRRPSSAALRWRLVALPDCDPDRGHTTVFRPGSERTFCAIRRE